MFNYNLTFHLGKHDYQLRLNLGFSLFSLFFFILFCILGVWQLNRYQQKQKLLDTYQQRLHSPPQSLPLLLASKTDLQFQKVVVTGYFVNSMIVLLQNQYQQGEPGYEVIIPLSIPGEKKLLLIDKGWVSRKNLPSLRINNKEQLSQYLDFTKNIPVATQLKQSSVKSSQVNKKDNPNMLEKVKLKGYIKLLNERAFILGKNRYSSQFPLIMQKIDISELEHVSHQSFFPFILRLDSAEQDGLIRNWIIVTVTPERHLGYSIQWFLMAVVLLIAYICFCCEKIKDGPRNHSSNTS